MKKLGKLSINPEKVIKNEELVNLRGGSIEAQCYQSTNDLTYCEQALSRLMAYYQVLTASQMQIMEQYLASGHKTAFEQATDCIDAYYNTTGTANSISDCFS